MFFKLIETLRVNIVQELTYGEDTFIVDSMPLPISKFSRAKRLKRRNQKNYRKYPAVFRKVRIRTETFYSQMLDNFEDYHIAD